MSQDSSVPPDDDYLPYGVDINAEDDTNITKPNFELITTMLRNAAPNYSNDKIEEAFGYRGLLLDQCTESSDAEQLTPQTGNVDMKGDNLQLNPESPEFIPTAVQPTKAPEQMTPCTSLSENTSSQVNDISEEVEAINVDTTNNSIHSLESLSDCDYPVPCEEAAEAPVSQPVNDAFNIPSSALNKKIKRNCLMQSMFQRYSRGEPQKALENIEVNAHFLTSLGIQAQPAEEIAPQHDSSIEVKKLENKIVELHEVTDESSEDSNDSLLQFRREITQNATLCNSADKLGSCDRVISISANNKVLDWLSSDTKKDSAKIVAKTAEPIKLDDNAFALKVTNKDEPKPSANDSNWRSEAREATTMSPPITPKKPKVFGLQVAMNATKDLSVKDIYKNLMAKRESAAKVEPQGSSKSVHLTKDLVVQDIYKNLRAKRESSTKTEPHGSSKSVHLTPAIAMSSNTLWDKIEMQLTNKKKKQ